MVWERWRRGGVESDKLCDEMLMQERPPQKGGSQLCMFAKEIPGKTRGFKAHGVCWRSRKE